MACKLQLALTLSPSLSWPLKLPPALLTSTCVATRLLWPPMWSLTLTLWCPISLPGASTMPCATRCSRAPARRNRRTGTHRALRCRMRVSRWNPSFWFDNWVTPGTLSFFFWYHILLVLFTPNCGEAQTFLGDLVFVNIIFSCFGFLILTHCHPQFFSSQFTETQI
jgi:hypothetical protein